MTELKLTLSATAPPNLRPIFDTCLKQLSNPLSAGRLSLVLRGMKPAHQTHRYLCGRKSPKGEIVADGDGDTQIVSFKAIEVLAWMTAHKFCTAETTTGG